MSVKQEKKKGVAFKTADKKTEVSFYPVFEVRTPDSTNINITEKEVDCRFVEMTYRDDKNKEQQLMLNYLDLFMFVYMCADEEMRQQLQMRYERQSGQIPYEVTFSLSDEEKRIGVAKRLITLTVDEITMAVARSAANKLLGKTKPEFIESYIARKTKKPTIQDPGHYTNR